MSHALAFDSVDQNGDGMIDRQEYQAAFPSTVPSGPETTQGNTQPSYQTVDEPDSERRTSRSAIPPSTEKLVDQLYDSTWNFKALKYLGTTSEEVVAITKALRDNFSVTAVYDMRGHGGSGGIDDETCRHLASALRVNGTVTKLNLNSHGISDEGVKYLANMLTASQCSIRKISLWGSTRLGDQGVQYLANALKHNSSVREVFVKGTSISEVGAGYLADATRMNENIQKLSVESSGINTEGSHLTKNHY